MLNYFGTTVELHRYFVGFMLISLSFILGKSAAIKQISKILGM